MRSSPLRLPDVLWPVFVLTALSLFLGHNTVLGADTLWAATIGDEIISGWAIPEGVPYSVLPTADWVNVPVLGEVVLSLAAGLGPSGLVALQSMCVIAALTVTWLESRRQGARPVAVAVVVLLAFGAILSMAVVIRMPVLSLFPWVILVALLRRTACKNLSWPRSVGILGLLIVWGSLHGGVLVGTALLVVFSLFAPRHAASRRQRGMLAGGGLAGVFLITVQGWDTWRYYRDALTNEAARSGTQLWARPDFRNPLDVLMVLCLVLLGVAFVRARPAAWEIASSLGMAGAIVMSARHAVWLALFLAPVASRGLTRTATCRVLSRRIMVMSAVAGLVISMGVVHGRIDSVMPIARTAYVIQKIVDNRPVLATEPLAEALAYAGARTVMGNPLDAFARSDQRHYLDFVEGVKLADRLLVPHAIIAAPTGSAAAQLAATDDRLVPLDSVEGVRLWEVSGNGTR